MKLLLIISALLYGCADGKARVIRKPIPKPAWGTMCIGGVRYIYTPTALTHQVNTDGEVVSCG